MNAAPTRILVVDDSALYRQSIQNVLRELADVAVVGTAGNGIEALEKIKQLNPDLLTLDVQMPDMDGIQLLREIRRRRLRVEAIMVSNHTSEGAQVTTDALLEGAFDFILKPSTNEPVANRQLLRDSLASKISAFRSAACGRRGSVRPAVRARSAASRPIGSGEVSEPAPTPNTACRAVVIGASTGGPQALKIVLSKLPAELGVPVLVVQHMPAQYTRSLALRLDEVSQLSVVEGTDGLEAAPGMAVVAPGGRQMCLEDARNSLRLRVSDDPPENGVRPSVDYLLRSASDLLRGGLLAVILTGMGRDGLAGCRQLKQGGGFVFAQSQDDCVVFGMPKAVIDEQLADRTLPLPKIAPAIVRHLKRSRRT